MVKQKNAVIALGYWFSARSLGLVVHPYVTMRKIMREKFLRPLTLLPLVSGMMMWLGTMAVVRVGGFGLRYAGISLDTWIVWLLGFIFWWVAGFLVLWQMVLIYLYVRFWEALKD